MSKIPVSQSTNDICEQIPLPAPPKCSVTPRIAGYAKVIDNSMSRSKRIIESMKKEPFSLKKSKVKVDECDDILAATISCVMMMAIGAHDIPEESLIWADNYLSRIKNVNGEYPPNVMGILNHIKSLRSDLTNVDVGACRCRLRKEKSKTLSPQANAMEKEPNDTVEEYDGSQTNA
ncbi:hypothetical protein FQA39_LY05970 [Lamprigera yunnana]|nr:hypothetical protein FQA39_LY05970 [Lamprigera yunnana]